MPSRSSLTYRFVSLLLAVTFLCFHVEPFEEEYEAHHRPIGDECAIGSPTLTWETYGKSNAPKAFTIDVQTIVEIICTFEVRQYSTPSFIPPIHPVRDKSPPPIPSSHT